LSHDVCEEQTSIARVKASAKRREIIEESALWMHTAYKVWYTRFINSSLPEGWWVVESELFSVHALCTGIGNRESDGKESGKLFSVFMRHFMSSLLNTFSTKTQVWYEKIV
jgi:hypothetical protein